AFYELWKHKDMQSEENDCNCLLEILNELMTEDLDNERKNHLISLQTVNKKANTSVRLLEEIQDVDINDLTYDDPLANGIIDLGSSQYQLIEDDYDVLVGEKGGIRNLRKGAFIKEMCEEFIIKRNEIHSQCKFIIAPSETRRHKEWIESENNRVITATNITDTLLQETKRNVFRKISKASENAFVDVIVRIMEASIYQMPVDFDIEVTRNDRQSIASQEATNLT
ncbi:11162_t:CDS:2, partial [Acaulospora colombiana]